MMLHPVDSVGCSLWEIIIHVSPAELAAQTPSLSHFNGDSVRGGCGYNIRVLLEQSDSLEML